MWWKRIVYTVILCGVGIGFYILLNRIYHNPLGAIAYFFLGFNLHMAWSDSKTIFDKDKK